MKITLLSDDAIRLEPTPGPLTIEAPTAEMSYSPFHMMASALASCTFSVMHSWATHKQLSADDLAIEVQWVFGDDPHRVSDYGVVFDWPSLPTERIPTAKRVAALCTVHATLMHPPRIDILAASEVEHEHHHDPTPA
jgi:putative redox protein